MSSRLNTSRPSTVEIDVEQVQFEFNVTHSFAPTELVEIRNTNVANSADILLCGLIDNTYGVTRIAAVGGDILRGSSTGMVRTNALELQTVSGNVGTAAERLPVELVSRAGHPAQLTAGGRRRCPLGLETSDARRGPDVGPRGLGPITAGGDIDLVLQAAGQDTQSLVNMSYVVHVKETRVPQTTPVSVHFRPQPGDPPAQYQVPQFGSGGPTVDSSYTFSTLTAGGNISVQAMPASTTIAVAGETDLLDNGRIDVATNGDITLVEKAGDMRVGAILSSSGNATLTSPSSIVDADALPEATPVAADVAGLHIQLTAQAGSVGTPANDLEIDTLADSSLDATGTLHVALTEIAGTLTVNQVSAATGNVRLSVLDAAGTGQDLVVGVGRKVEAPNGWITLQAGDNVTLAGTVHAEATALLSIRGDFGNADPGLGSTINILSVPIAGATDIRSDTDGDTINASIVNLPQTVFGSDGSDTITLGHGDNIVDGGAGDDVITAGNGLNKINGGARRRHDHDRHGQRPDSRRHGQGHHPRRCRVEYGLRRSGARRDPHG